MEWVGCSIGLNGGGDFSCNKARVACILDYWHDRIAKGGQDFDQPLLVWATRSVIPGGVLLSKDSVRA